ncbi:DNA/RNA helicase, superfamily II [Bernardetia litoralis DSM 6794]|uniref:DEAD-box ATP-dependent RNA helicase RhpA n=1 Tax=Bernardetia litoralis (strain ATCC 23117 / DSM 6794 / NBRC 15988 / NCIMB 1366 / Fx l1 / Sio-4) TaxID=880071 RepID=I4AHL5_BERLS|nr:DEAD/DEAH box helicase [Bernardetia litoralis]AFM03450.1 DNA/RNA helicase, superfamily II [Bernardetia litoralis DSM 6794]
MEKTTETTKTKETTTESTEVTLKFTDMNLSDEVKRAVEVMGFESPSPIQAEAIPHLLEGKDVIGQAQTGTGKTAAFGIPLIERIIKANENSEFDRNSRLPKGIILCPTRELAVQVAGELEKLAKFRKDIFVTAVYGGESIEKQIRNLRRGVQIVVGTPGRTIDHIKRGTLKLEEITNIILDEADEMLNMGFKEDIELILQQITTEHQTVLFSATMPKPILQIAKKYQNSPEIVKVISKELTSDNIEQSFLPINPNYKTDVLVRLLAYNGWESMLIFCNTKQRTDEVAETLIQKGYAAEALHGDLAQHQRNLVMNKFRHGRVQILVATDVAARGIDVDNVEAVINYDVPLDPEYYVHRIGRTGRAGNKGVSITFISGRREVYRLNDIERYSKSRIPQGTIPTQQEVLAKKQLRFMENLKATINDEKKAEELESYTALIEMLEIEGITSKQVAAAVLSLQLSNKPTDRLTEAEIWDTRDRRRDGRGGRNDRGGRDRGGRNDRRGGGRDRDRGSRNRRDDRGGRDRNDRDRGSRPSYKDRGDRADMVRLRIDLGATENVRKGDILGAIAGETGMRGDKIGAIRVNEQESFVEVPQSDVDNVIRVMNKSKIKGKKVEFEKA